MTKKVTDLQAVKGVALQFLNLRPEPVNGIPFFVNHPFLESSMIPDSKNNIYNVFEHPEVLNDYRNRMKAIILKGKLETIFCYMSKKYQLAFLKYAKPYMSKEDFDRYLAFVWISSENPNQDATVKIRTLISWFKQANKNYLMEKDELQYYNNLPAVVKVYRGIAVGRANQKGLSWTCDVDKAIWFANRFNTKTQKGYLLEGNIHKEDIFAYFNGRQESEVLCNSSKIYNLNRINL